MKSFGRIKIFLILLFIFLLLQGNRIVYAAGEGNVDGGANGELGEGTHKNQWIPGDEGVRISIVDAETGSTMFTPIDFSRKSHIGQKVKYFEKESKLTYLCGKNLVPKEGNYQYNIPNTSLPIIISSDTYGKTDPKKIKSYFTDNTTLEQIAKIAGVSFEELIGGQYKLVLEPIIYFTFDNNYYAMTAHEFALCDSMLKGAMRAKFKTTVYKNLAYSMFLEYAELGIGAWTKGTEHIASIEDVISYLGIGIVHFKNNSSSANPSLKPEESEENSSPSESAEKLEINTSPYAYRVDTDVITSVEVHTQKDITPGNSISVIFYIDGKIYKVSDIIIPAGESQIVWCKWHTPKIPKEIIAYAKIEGQGKVEIPITIEELNESIPPDPKATDKRGNWKPIHSSDLPKEYHTNSLTWSKWYAVARLVEYTTTHTYINEDGEEITETKKKTRIEYDYYKNRYTASLTVDFQLTPDIYCPTAQGKIMGSGYGVNASVQCKMITSDSSNAVSGGQNSIFYFPEFTYRQYWRLGELTKIGLNTRLEFRKNPYSHFSSRTHFVPPWYPDGVSNYQVYVQVIDAWTPAGMLRVSDMDSISIKGTVFDDWHIGEVLEED